MRFIYIVFATFLIFSCNSTQPDSNSVNKQTAFIVTKGSPVLDKIKLHELKTIEKDTFKYVKSRIQYSEENVYHLSLPIAGFLRKSYTKSGDKVRKGEKVALIEHPEFLEIKRDYLKAKVEFDYYKQTYLRQGELAIDQATSLKKMQVSERDYKNAEIDLKHFELILKQIGVQADDLNENNLSAFAYLYSPVSGIISQDFSVPGSYYDNSRPVYYISTNPVLSAKFVLDGELASNLKLDDVLELQVENQKFYEGKITSIMKNKKENELVYTLSTRNSDKLHKGKSVGIKVPVVIKFMEIPLEAIVDDEWIIWQKSENIFERVKISPYKLEQNQLLIFFREELESARIVTQGTNELMQIH